MSRFFLNMDTKFDDGAEQVDHEVRWRCEETMYLYLICIPVMVIIWVGEGGLK